MKAFGNRISPVERSVQDCVQIVEAFLRSVGLDPIAQRLPDPNTLGWLVVRGSAKTFIFIGNIEGTTTVEIVSPILHLPSQNILPFYRRCLELNRFLVNCALCVNEDQVMLVSARPVEGLDYVELQSTLHFLTGAADALDNQLAEEFGAKPWMGG